MSRNQEDFDRYQAASKAVFADLSWVGEVAPRGFSTDTEDFVAVANELFEYMEGKFLQDDPNFLPHSITQHGFVVAACGMARSSEGYLEHCQQAEQAPSQEVFLEALLSPKTVRFFTYIASMRQVKNTEYETWLGLRRMRAMDETEFLYNPDEQHFVPNPFIQMTAETEARRKAIEKGVPTTLTDEEPFTCPAKQFIPALWRITATGCTQAGLFDFDQLVAPHVPRALELDLSKL